MSKDKSNIVSDAMRRAGVRVLLSSDYGNPIMFETEDDIVKNIFTEMFEVFLNEGQCKVVIIHHDIETSDKQRP